MLLAGAGKINCHVTSDCKLEEDERLYNAGIKVEIFPCYPEKDET
jgi:hypothetical protein